MKYIILIGTLLIIASCSSDKTTGTAQTDTVAKAPIAHALCFLLTGGADNRDSTSVELVIKNNKVTGLMNWLPYQKDSRKGTLTGSLNNDSIQVTWHFMQEGVKDTLNLQFKLDSTRLLQKPLKLNIKTGCEQTDPSADYTLIYHTSDKVYD